MTYLLDTDHLTILQQQDGAEWAAVVANIDARGQENVAAPVVSFHEQVLGCHSRINQARGPQEMVRWYRVMGELLDMYSALPLAPFDAAAAAALVGLLALNTRVAAMDLRIAAIAPARGSTVATRNVADFGRIPGLRTEDWTRGPVTPPA